jgi:GntR family transcriptional regulator
MKIVRLDLDSPVPLYHQLIGDLRSRVSSGHWPVGHPIPPERELTETYGVSRATVRQAISALVSEGLLYREQGKGTFVGRTRPIVATLSSLIGHIEELRQQGIHADVVVLESGQETATAAACAAFDLPDGTVVPFVRRLATVAEGPLVVLQHYLSPKLDVELDPAELGDIPILTLLERRGIRVTHGRQHIRAAAAREADAVELGVPIASPILEVTRTVYAAEETPVEWTCAVYHPERYGYDVELRRGPASH